MKSRGLKTIALVAVVISLSASCKINAQNGNGRQGQEPPSVDEIFERMDKDEDGKLSKEEIKGPLKNDFSKIDVNEDDFLSKEEVEKAPKPKRRPKRN